MGAKIINFPGGAHIAPRPTAAAVRIPAEGFIRLAELFPNSATGWMLTAVGDPMEDCDIRPGDLLYVDTTAQARAGDIGIFEQADGALYVHEIRLGVAARERGRLVGVVTHVIRDRRAGREPQPA